jgi:hypothetical protein
MKRAISNNLKSKDNHFYGELHRIPLKIKNNNEMKTMSSRLRKTGMETMAVIVVLVASCLTISAQGAKFENNELNGTTMAMADISKNVISADAGTKADATLAAFAAYLVEEKEAELETEEWMLNVDNFYLDYHLDEAAETALELEDWMFNGKLFESSAKTEMSVTENAVKAEPRKKAVGITFKGTQFGRRSFILIEDDDPKMEMEQWMLSYKHFDKK